MAFPNRIARLAYLSALLMAGSGAFAQGTASDPGLLTLGPVKLGTEIKANFRSTKPLLLRFTLPDGSQVPAETPSSGGSFEISNISLVADATLTPDITGKIEIHFIDLYNRNPTSSGDKVEVREAWLRFGTKYAPMKLPPGTSFYLQLGKAPRFSKQVVRRLESYGLWGTAVGRFEEIGAEAGASFGQNVYMRAQVVNGNPLFMRDTNALAGDHGTPDRAPGSVDPPVYGTGFPIIYDAKATEVNFSGKVQYGFGLGTRFSGEGWGVDVMGWYFNRDLQDRVPIKGSFYQGDLEFLRGVGGVGLAVSGNDKTEYGVNLDLRWKGFSMFGQYVRQDIAGLVRKGYEVEAAYRFPLPGLFASGDTPVVNWIAPSVRVSRIDNDFGFPSRFVAPSFAWDWTKFDFGLRIGIIRGVDLTVEYSRHDMIRASGVSHPDEFLTTLRAAF
jgi:hypothetical protein